MDGVILFQLALTGTKLFDDGSLCDADACEATCNICLRVGSYVFRVTGPTYLQ